MKGIMGKFMKHLIPEEKLNTVVCAGALCFTKSLPDASVDCVITSPPYYQLRDYAFTEQWGLEKTYQEYLDNLILVNGRIKTSA